METVYEGQYLEITEDQFGTYLWICTDLDGTNGKARLRDLLDTLPKMIKENLKNG